VLLFECAFGDGVNPGGSSLDKLTVRGDEGNDFVRIDKCRVNGRTNVEMGKGNDELEVRRVGRKPGQGPAARSRRQPGGRCARHRGLRVDSVSDDGAPVFSLETIIGASVTTDAPILLAPRDRGRWPIWRDSIIIERAEGTAGSSTPRAFCTKEQRDETAADDELGFQADPWLGRVPSARDRCGVCAAGAGAAWPGSHGHQNHAC
jgi:hypothetical protein